MQTPKQNQHPTHLAAYRSNAEFLFDMMHSLDQKLEAKITQRSRSDEAIDQLRGLVISNDQVLELLDRQSPEDAALSSREKAILDFELEIQGRLKSTKSGIPFAVIQQLFNLNRIEAFCLEVCLSREIDPKYETLFAYVHDDVTRKNPSIQLVLDLVCKTLDEKITARTLFRKSSALFRHGLIEKASADSTSLMKTEIRLDERVVEFLLANRCLASDLEKGCKLLAPIGPGEIQTNPATDQIRIAIQRAQLKNPSSRNLILHLSGDTDIEEVREFVQDLDTPLLSCSANELLLRPIGFASKLCREAALQPAILHVSDFELLSNSDKLTYLKDLLEEIQTYSRLTILSGTSSWIADNIDPDSTAFVSIALPKFSTRERSEVWQKQLNGLATENETDWLASQFRFSRSEIARAANHAMDRVTIFSGNNELDSNAFQLKQSCQELSKQNLEFGNLARRIEPRGTWESLVLPGDVKSHLMEICHQAKQRHTVFEKWGFDNKLNNGKGISVLYAGSSGTGKTLAAEVMANELEMELFKIDLSQVVNKYIGETEKNLGRIFDAAANANVILFFDESDALFGKRSEVRDSHDRYSNLEVSFLLQKMEEFDGVSILATNLRKNMDDAFVRRPSSHRRISVSRRTKP